MVVCRSVITSVGSMHYLKTQALPGFILKVAGTTIKKIMMQE
jgi:hypothetical protein